MKKENVTIYDIAKESNVSPATVSRVLTGNAKVRPKTMQRIIDVIEKHNFRPNSLARSLLHKSSKTIGFILPDINHPFFSTLVQKGEAYALELGYTTFLCNTMNNSENESKYLQSLVEKQVDGIIYLGGRINATDTDEQYAEEIKKVMERVPVVFVNGQMTGVDAHIVRTNEEIGIEKLVELLVNLNHKKIGFLGGVEGISSTDLKKNTFLNVMKNKGLVVNSDWMIGDGFNIESGEEVASKLLYLKERPTAVICANDLVAIGVIRVLTKFGLKVPDDISVVGFDDIYLAQYFPPGITTVNQNYDQLGQTAINVLVDLINGKEAEKETVVPTSLILRDSCKFYTK
ncbi:LacI family DNA-binding transcriptional regulator [Mesobacillus foraminis]|uniref:LacI family transcriptional regulator/LacI family purine nucleotide synthesis repressor/LacI family repressor for deo operon, udp, cdd, tsx, nupC, and nupG n=1 Tax=Mesobacillus foraminis TaxID=279826 RepID=A0A4R2BJU4_9BACI|nr:LacI family DNA-binding transcriptional regulator [Mesobacillus foraminis]TCN27468.1 LacI family transcriptional regulator/LacI family purine nucleotide synthesis repressor/LacI family repressor for deo operon, udp, cdd, tsx, nupC, and nupG [Mesobacillus foraminis]